MALEIITKEVNDIIVVQLKGNLDTNTAPDAETCINDYLENGIQKIIINLGHTKYVSSAGLRVFLATAKKLTASGGAVKLCSANEVVRKFWISLGLVPSLM